MDLATLTLGHLKGSRWVFHHLWRLRQRKAEKKTRETNQVSPAWTPKKHGTRRPCATALSPDTGNILGVPLRQSRLNRRPQCVAGPGDTQQGGGSVHPLAVTSGRRASLQCDVKLNLLFLPSTSMTELWRLAGNPMVNQSLGQARSSSKKFIWEVRALPWIGKEEGLKDGSLSWRETGGGVSRAPGDGSRVGRPPRPEAVPQRRALKEGRRHQAQSG